MNAKTKVCHIVVLSHLTGVQRVMFEICQSLDPDRYDRHVICKEEGPLTEELSKNGITWHLVPDLDRPIHLWKDLKSFLGIRKICRQHDFSLVHTHSSKPGFLGRIAARSAGVPHIFHHIHGYAFHEYSPRSKTLIYSFLEKIAAKFSTLLIFVNDEERMMTIEKRWAPEEKCITIFNGTDIHRFQPGRDHPETREAVRTQLGLTESELGILICGRLDQQKQSLILPLIAERLHRKNPDARWRFIVAGTGDLDKELEDLVNEKGLADRFQLLGWYSKPYELMTACDLKLLPSLWEGLPLTLIESQASGLPIVASNIKGNREVVTPETGFLCEPENPEDYATCLDELCRDDSLRASMQQSARLRAETAFDLERTIAQIREEYESRLF